MECIGCNKEDSKNLIYDTDYWKIILANDQYYLGRTLVSAKRHIPNMSEINAFEWNDFHDVLENLESAITKAFDARMFNWNCLLNDAYQKTPPMPHVHWHLRPRYDHPVDFAGLHFVDENFGHFYQRESRLKVTPEQQEKIITAIRENIIL